MRILESWRGIRKNINLRRGEEIHFLKSDWEDQSEEDTVSLPYFCYRALYFLIFIAIIAQSIHCEPIFDYFFIFLTNLSLLTQLLYSGAFFLQVLRGLIRGGKEERIKITPSERYRHSFGQNVLPPRPKLSILASSVWFLFNVTIVLPLVVTAIYWGFLFDWKVGQEWGFCALWSNLCSHAFNSALALIDFAIIGVPIVPTHVIYTILIGLLYFLFSLFYELAGATYPGSPDENFIYDILDWNEHPGLATLWGLGGILGFLIVHNVLVWGLYQFRLFCVSRLVNEDIYSVHDPSKRGSIVAYENKGYVV